MSPFIRIPYRVFAYLGLKNHFKRVPDKRYLELMYMGIMGYRLDLKAPLTFNEKLQWLKLYDRRQEYIHIVDKYEAKAYVGHIIGEKYIVPTYGIWDAFDKIDFNMLPDKFVMKCTHNSGGVVVCHDKNALDISAARDLINRNMAKNYYWFGREWPYREIKPRIIVEELLEDESGGLVDYKFFCFNGTVDCVMVCIDRQISDPKYYFFDKEWCLKRLNIRGMEAPEGFTLRKPECYEEMISIAEQLSTSIPFVRIDLYECRGHIYFGEMTLYPQSGYDKNLLPDTDRYFGSMIKLFDVT